MLTGRIALKTLNGMMKVIALETTLEADIDTSLLDRLEHLLGFRGESTAVGGDIGLAKDIIELFRVISRKGLYDVTKIEEELSLIFRNEEVLAAMYIESMKVKPLSPHVMIAMIRSRMAKEFSTYELENKLQDYMYRFTKTLDPDKKQVILDEINKLTSGIDVSSNEVDPAIVGELDSSNKEAMAEELEKIDAELSEDNILSFLIQDMNEMTQGGVRRGELLSVGGLSHNGKSLFSLVLWLQSILGNKPKNVLFPDKKPLALWITMEDNLSHLSNGIFTYLYMDEFGLFPERNVMTPVEKADYIHKRLTANGWNFKIMKVDPSDWSFSKLFSLINAIEYKGYEIIITGLDYISLIPTTGTTGTGAMGTDMRELVRRIKNFFNRKKIAIISPLQLSPDATKLLRNGVPDSEMTAVMSNRSYYSGSTQITQDLDLETLIHKVPMDGKTYLSVHRGKHRLPTTITDNKKSFFIEFPTAGMFTGDMTYDLETNTRTNKEKKITLRTLDNISTEGFSFG